MIEFVLPATFGEWMAWLTALATVLIGLCLMAFPRPLMAWLGLVPRTGHEANGVSEIRGPFGGVWVGLGLASLLLAQPLVYLTLGLAFLVAVVGRLVSMVLDRSFNIHCCTATVLEALSAYFPIAYGLGWIA